MNDVGNNRPPAGNDADQPIPFDDSDDSIQLDDKPAGGSPGVSRAPLNLGGSSGAPAPAPTPARKKPAAPAKAPSAGSAPTKPSVGSMIGAGDRISGCKTFFTKLHAGAIEFLDEQITNWLRDNPEIVIKSTNVSVGEVAAKKTEPNILVVVWY